jgi:aminoglycoside phosphotransferase (APT) family kinase protein
VNALTSSLSAPTPPGIAVGPVSAWLSRALSASAPPYAFERVVGGHSNLTYIVTDRENAQWVLRRPPLGKLLPTAHDVGREFRIISALGPSLPVPPVVGLCGDESVTGAPFYVMDKVDGIVIRDEATAIGYFSKQERHRVGLAVADALAAIHAVLPSAVGLGDLGRPDDYIGRQLRRWKRQVDQSKTRELPRLDRVLEQLWEHLPAQTSTALVHGDFRLDNCIIGQDGTVRAVLDWELCTVGEPLADLGLLMVYWTEPGDELRATAESPTAAPGFPSRSAMLERYARTLGRSLPAIDFYIAFSYWRLACISEGVLARYLRGEMGNQAGESEGFSDRVTMLIEAAERITSQW